MNSWLDQPICLLAFRSSVKPLVLCCGVTAETTLCILLSEHKHTFPLASSCSAALRLSRPGKGHLSLLTPALALPYSAAPSTPLSALAPRSLTQPGPVVSRGVSGAL